MAQLLHIVERLRINEESLPSKRVCHLNQLKPIRCNEDLLQAVVLLVTYRAHFFGGDSAALPFAVGSNLKSECVTKSVTLRRLLQRAILRLIEVQRQCALDFLPWGLTADQHFGLIALVGPSHRELFELRVQRVVIDLGVAHAAADLGVVRHFELS